MSSRRLFAFAGLTAGLAATALLLWLWREDTSARASLRTRRARAAEVPRAPSPEETPRAEAAGPLPPADAALAALLRAIARGQARPNEALFSFKDDDALRRFLARLTGTGLTATGQIDALRAVRIRFDDPEALRRALDATADAALGANPLVGVPLPPAKEARAAHEQVPFGNETLAFIGATGDRSAWGRGTTIAILDTGVAADATFGPGRLRSLDIGLGASPGRGEEDGHGTAVAALAAGAASDAPGVAPAASLLSIRVTDASALSDLFTLSQGIVAAVDAGARIINISLGGYATGAVLDAALAYAGQNGALVVAAAGNDQAAQLAWPAADARVISVGAVDRAEQQVSFSNSGAQLQLSAPGYGVQTAWLDGQRVYVDGTSASSPLVAGAIAAVMSLNPSLSPRQAAALLTQTANDTGQPGSDSAFGHGIVNLASALNRANPTYVDTAVSSHYYDAARGEMQFTVQNRSGRTVSGLALSITAGTTQSSVPVPGLAAGETYVASVPIAALTPDANGQLSFVTRLNNPPGTTDAFPANNQRSSTLTPPPKP